jgi:Tetracyclin repressor-like, C-terminal domain
MAISTPSCSPRAATRLHCHPNRPWNSFLSFNRLPSSDPLATRFRDQLNQELFATKTVEEIPRRYLDWAEEHPHEYQLLFRSWTDIIHPDLPRPGRMWLMPQLANRFGGTPDQYARAFTALFLLAHGAADLLTTTTDDLARNEVRSHFLAAAGALLNNIAILRP